MKSLSLWSPFRACASFRSAAIAVICISLPSFAAAEDESVKLLTIGNSFANNAVRFLPELAEAEGKKLEVGRANLGGASLERHMKHVHAYEADSEDPEGRPYTAWDVFPPSKKKGEPRFSLQEILEAEDWDYITIQQQSWDSRAWETFEPHAGELIERIRKHAPNAEILIHQTWAYRDDHPSLRKNPDDDQKKMFADIAANYAKLAERYDLRIIPVGAAFQLAREWRPFTFPDPDFDYKNPKRGTKPNQEGSLVVGWSVHKENGRLRASLDAKHANTAGEYLGACVFFNVIFDEEASGNPFLPKDDLSAKDARHLQKLADKAVEEMKRAQ